MGTGSFPEVKCGRGVLLTTHPLLVRGHGRVELYLYPPSGPHRTYNGITLPLPYCDCNSPYVIVTITVCFIVVLLIPLRMILQLNSNWLFSYCEALTTSRISEHPMWMHNPSRSLHHVSCNSLPHTCCGTGRNCAPRETAGANCLLS